jgi:two-component system, chemotaxis family, chemotaxis protein CheY
MFCAMIPASTATPPRRKPRLLIVEDEADLRVLILFAAKRAEVFSTICTAQDGAEALELVQAGVRGDRADMPPDIVFTDYNMPRVNGLELCEHLRDHAETAGIVVALFTSAHSPADRAAAKRAGVCAHFRKPAGLNELIAILRSLPIFARRNLDGAETAPRIPEHSGHAA